MKWVKVNQSNENCSQPSVEGEFHLFFPFLARGLVGVFEGSPLEGGSVDGNLGLAILRRFEMLFHQLGRDADHVLTFPILDHVQRLKRRNDVGLRV